MASAPRIGSVWVWEPLNWRVREQVIVTDVRDTDDDIWVESESQDGNCYWNELDRWQEAAVLLDGAG